MDAWFELEAEGKPHLERARLLRAGLTAVWARAHPTLGEVTMRAVGRRALHAVLPRAPLLEAVTLGEQGFELPTEVRRHGTPPAEVEAALRMLLGELLHLLSAITAGVLEPALLQELSKVTAGGRTRRKPTGKGRRRT